MKKRKSSRVDVDMSILFALRAISSAWLDPKCVGMAKYLQYVHW